MAFLLFPSHDITFEIQIYLFTHLKFELGPMEIIPMLLNLIKVL